MIVAAKVPNAARGVERKAVKNFMNLEKHNAANRIAANVILADPVKYDGARLQWAKAFIVRMAK